MSIPEISSTFAVCSLASLDQHACIVVRADDVGVLHPSILAKVRMMPIIERSLVRRSDMLLAAWYVEKGRRTAICIISMRIQQ